MRFFDVVRTRRSIRKFHARAIEAGALSQILDAAAAAPSAGNLQAYQILIVRDPGLRLRLAEAAGNQTSFTQAPIVLVFCADPARSAARYGARGQELFCIQDATIACAYAQLAATALGLSSVWIGVAFEPETIQDALGLTDDLWPIVLLPLGYAAETPAPKTRRTVSEISREV